ncbi:MAG: HEPN domain-containing protein [Planctomycetota bacterium]
MPPEKPVDRWLRKAAEDLRVAEILLKSGDPAIPYGAICFHAQQAAEKYLKGWLVSRGRPAPRTHSLLYLVSRAEGVDGRFRGLREIAERLTPFAVASRYPGDIPDPEEPEALKAIERAKAIRDFVERLSPPPPEQRLPIP